MKNYFFSLQKRMPYLLWSSLFTFFSLSVLTYFRLITNDQIFMLPFVLFTIARLIRKHIFKDEQLYDEEFFPLLAEKKIDGNLVFLKKLSSDGLAIFGIAFIILVALFFGIIDPSAQKNLILMFSFYICLLFAGFFSHGI